MKKRFTSILLTLCLMLILPITAMAQTAVTLTQANPTTDVKVGSGTNGRVAITVTAPASGTVTLQTANVGAFVQPRLYDAAGKQLATTAAANSNIRYTVPAGQTQTIYAGTSTNAAATYTITATFPSGTTTTTPATTPVTTPATTPTTTPATTTTTTPATTPTTKPTTLITTPDTTPLPTPTPTLVTTPAPNQTPVVGDFTIGNLSQTADSVKAVTVTPKSGKSGGAITVLYNGSATLPTQAGTYKVTFNVAAISGWNAASGLAGGNLTVKAAPAPATTPTPTVTPPTTPSAGMPISTRKTVNYTLRESTDLIGNKYLWAICQRPSVMTFVNNDGSITVCASDESTKTTYVYEYNANLQEQRSFNIKNEFEMLGAFTKDTDGNYYFFFGVGTEDKDAENMAMVKYNRNGQQTKKYKLIAYAPDSFNGINIPFHAGTCRLELSGSMLVAYFGRQKYMSADGKNHQSSYGFILDKDTFERIDIGQVSNTGFALNGNNVMPYCSHSFNQFVLPIDNGFVFADHGDAYPRSFVFSKMVKGSITKKIQAFTFSGATGENATYAEMGGMAKTSTGFIFAGTYGTDLNTARNLFVLTIDDNMSSCSAPIYLTNYTTTNGHAGHPKIVAIGSGNYLILWEVFEFSTQGATIRPTTGKTKYRATYSMVVNEKGQVVRKATELTGVRLNMNDTLRYNPSNKTVYWAVNNDYKEIVVYSLKP